MERAVKNPGSGVDMSRIALHAWAETLRDPDIAQHVEYTLRRLRDHYAEPAAYMSGVGALVGTERAARDGRHKRKLERV